MFSEVTKVSETFEKISSRFKTFLKVLESVDCRKLSEKFHGTLGSFQERFKLVSEASQGVSRRFRGSLDFRICFLGVLWGLNYSIEVQVVSGGFDAAWKWFLENLESFQEGLKAFQAFSKSFGRAPLPN